MEQSSFVPEAMAQLGTLLQTLINCILAPTNASCLLAAVKEWVSSVWLPFVGGWREF
jgi:hypothetical protein